MKIGFIGLGIMGRPMAKNLIKAGYKLTVYDKFAKFDDIIALGADGASSNKEVASKNDLVITMLPNSPHVKEAILGERRPSSTFLTVISLTVSPTFAPILRARVSPITMSRSVSGL